MSDKENMTPETAEVKEPKKDNGNMKKIVIAIIILLLLLIIGLLGWNVFGPQDDSAAVFENAIKAELGQLENKTEAEIEAELNRTIEEGSMHISINMNPVFVDGASEGTLQIENSPANKYAQDIVITIDETGEVIYKSGLLLPNYHIQNDKLLVDLDAGNYECTATFSAYDLELTEDAIPVGTAAAKIKISVLS